VTCAPALVHTVLVGVNVIVGAARVQEAVPNDTLTCAPVDDTDVGVIVMPVCGSTKLAPAGKPASDHELVAGVMSSR
jgi:hypothetical protein